MSGNAGRERAEQPNDLGRFFVERANAGDVEGLVALYESDAVLTFPPGQVTTGTQAIRQVFEQFLAGRPTLTPGKQQPALEAGDLALTSTRLASGEVTAEVARRQPDGTWLWIIDQTNVVS